MFYDLVHVPDPRPSKAHPEHRARRKEIEKNSGFDTKEVGIKGGLLLMLGLIACFPWEKKWVEEKMEEHDLEHHPERRPRGHREREELEERYREEKERRKRRERERRRDRRDREERERTDDRWNEVEDGIEEEKEEVVIKIKKSKKGCSGPDPGERWVKMGNPRLAYDTKDPDERLLPNPRLSRYFEDIGTTNIFKAMVNVYLKLENLQPSGSFKSRGIANLMQRAIQSHGPSKSIHFYCSSGGNAGLACATAAIAFQQPATIVVSNLTSVLMVEKLKTLGADVVQRGNGWDEADHYLREELLGNDPNGVYVPPFDHEDLWEGHRTLVDELEIQMADKSYDAIVCSVGGGGLFAGIMEGLSRHGRLHGGHSQGVKILAMETKGADCLSHSLKQGRLSRLGEMTSIATSLGATQVAEKAFGWAQREEVVSCVVSDAVAAMGSVHFADDERILVETACGVSVAPAYNGMLHSILFPKLSMAEFAKLNIVLVICGGSNVTLQMLESYRQKYSQDAEVLATFNTKQVE